RGKHRCEAERQVVVLRPRLTLARLPQPRPNLHDVGRTGQKPRGDLAHRLALSRQHTIAQVLPLRLPTTPSHRHLQRNLETCQSHPTAPDQITT
ncbi:MAG: hypothetical protein JWO24_2871, partial [Rhodospirillales bacterium]|nr:hypothetical protein [Rhodospirillales bacterium]